MLRPGIREYFRLRPRGRGRVTAQVAEEMALHIELRTRELMAAGMEEWAARTEAGRRFGEADRARVLLERGAARRERRLSVGEWLAEWRSDLSFSARSLWRERLVATVIVLTLALGIGANATMFGVVDRLLLRGPAHVVSPAQVRRLYVTEQSWDGVLATQAAMGYVHYTLLRARTDLFRGAAAYYASRARLGPGTASREITAGYGTADLFPLLGVQPVLGRFFTAAEDRPAGPERVAVLDYALWQAEYGGVRDVLGRSVQLGDDRYTIVGVAPPGFTGPELKHVDVWLPLSTGWKPHPEWPTTWNARWLAVLLRLAPGVSWEQAEAEATRLYRTAGSAERRTAAAAVLTLRPLGYAGSGKEPAEVTVSRWLAGVSLIVLLIACANVANLLLARAVGRRREVAVRLALGVSRGRLARLLLSETLLLSLAGGLLALALAWWGGQALRQVLLPDVEWGAPVDARVLAFSALAALLTASLIGLAPLLQSRTTNLTETLKATSLRAGSARGPLRTALTVLQAAFSVVLLIGAGLFVRSLWNAQHVPLGIEPDRVLNVWTVHADRGELPRAKREAQEAAQRLIVERLRANPGIASASAALGTPFTGLFGVDLRVPGRDSLPHLPGGGPFITAALPGYFETVGTRIVRGRGFEAGEGKGTEPVVVVGESMARALWAGEDPLRKCLVISLEDAPCARVVGIAEDAHRTGLRDEPAMQYYVPLGQESNVSGTSLLVRPRGDAAAFIPELRALLRRLDPAALFFEIKPLQERLDPQLRPWRLGASMFLVFGALALLIAAIGLYSVIAYDVAQRRTELGVRIALGARTAGIVRMVVRQGMLLVVAGVAAGGLLAYAAAGRIEALLFEQSARDPAVFGAVALVLELIAVLATVLPAWRAGRTDPLDALRTE